ncbi:hypothetical protein LguiB_015835 [Lonicera macranthoides]
MVVQGKGVVWAILIIFTSTTLVDVSLSYNRPPPRKSLSFSLKDEIDSAIPQQVHISMVGGDMMRISWITQVPTPSTVKYDTSPGVIKGIQSNGTVSEYKFLTYKSGEIHEVVIGPLNSNTVYYYRCGDSTLEFNFKTPPAQFPIKFAVSGDLGQTEWTKSTLQHISKSNYDVLLLPGDLSYADLVQPLWDSFGRLVEPLASQRPWMVTQGNHEDEKIPIIHREPFTAYNARWHMPFEESASNSNLFYSFEVAGVHVIMLGSYTDFNPGSSQYSWLESDLRKVDRKKTPWLVVLVHAPWYNSNTAHQGEKESVGMKEAMEGLLFGAHVDIIFTGHVHAYERFTRVYKDEANKCGPVHITIGDGGNREGLASKYQDPQPKISLFREASFGHGVLEVINGSHALWTWHRNDYDEAVVSDTFSLTALSSDLSCKP